MMIAPSVLTPPTPLRAENLAEALPHNAAIGLRMLSYTRGRAECAVDWRDDLTAEGDGERLDSGIIVTLMDNACGYAIWSALDRPLLNVTLTLRVDYLRKPTARCNLIGLADCYRITRQVAYARGVAHEGDVDDPVAQVHASFFHTREA